ncbi:glycerol-3-phosphate 1-O-acyltransferase PlsY [Desulfovibrio sp. OttesenSCG-928-G15]|nr:glycerol-3-phosphate 1-O-acyltransferase PlsY [Desulfovibrio sp. OttesenSCG-928-G15]
MFLFFLAIVVTIASFFIGSIPFGLLIAQKFCGIDPRQAGSHNVGATNVSRLCGFKWGLATLGCDLLKGFLPCFLLSALGGDYSLLAYPAGLALICGHMFSYFLQYKGGKGVATTVGVFLALAPLQLVLAGLACIFAIWRTGFVSAGSLTLVATLPLLFLVSARGGDLYFSLVVGALVVYAHRENIRRLIRGEEKSFLSGRGNP